VRKTNLLDQPLATGGNTLNAIARIFIIGLLYVLGTLNVFADSVASSVKSVSYTRLAMTADQQTYFVDEDVNYELKDFAPPAGPIGVALMQPAQSVVFTTLAGKWDGDWHPAPRKQFVILLGGTVEIEVASGDVRRFSAGDVVLLEDNAGRGHDTRVVSDAPARFAIVALPDK
jgi:quercetin dioxygenase-like cupin family protein